MMVNVDLTETEAPSFSYTATQIPENEQNPVEDLKRQREQKRSPEKKMSKWIIILCGILAAAVVTSAIAIGKELLKAEPGEPLKPPPFEPQPKEPEEPEPKEPEPKEPEPKEPEPKEPEPEIPPPKRPPAPRRPSKLGSFVHTLKEDQFVRPYEPTEDEVRGLIKLLAEKPEVVKIRGVDVQGKHLSGIIEGKKLNEGVMDVYVTLIQDRIDERVVQKLQADVVILGPGKFSRSWNQFFWKGELPHLFEGIDIQRCRAASKVLIVLPAPHLHSSKGHYVLAVLDQDQKKILIVDSHPRDRQYYEPIFEFLTEITRQMNGTPSNPVSNVSEQGFPIQAESLKKGTIKVSDLLAPHKMPGYTHLPATAAEILQGGVRGVKRRSGLFSASGVMALENTLCIAEGRAPNYTPLDAFLMRWRILKELIQGKLDHKYLESSST